MSHDVLDLCDHYSSPILHLLQCRRFSGRLEQDEQGGRGAKPTYNPGLPIDAYPISLLASGLRSGLVCHEPLQFWHRYVSGQPPSMQKYEKNPKECTNQSSCQCMGQTQRKLQYPINRKRQPKGYIVCKSMWGINSINKESTYKPLFAGASDSLPCMWPTFAGARVKKKKTGSTLRVFSGVVEWCILQPCTVYCLSTRFSVSIHFGAWRPPKGTLDFRSSAMRW